MCFGTPAPDRAALQAVLAARPVDLVLHGHTHRPYAGPLLPDASAARPWVYESGSSTLMPSARRPRAHIARYNVYEFAASGGSAGPVRLRSATAYVLDPVARVFQPQPLVLPPV